MSSTFVQSLYYIMQGERETEVCAESNVVFSHSFYFIYLMSLFIHWRTYLKYRYTQKCWGAVDSHTIPAYLLYVQSS
jgi:hypothetical protein